MLFAGGVGSPPSPADHHSPPPVLAATTSSQVATGPSRRRLHAAGCSATATGTHPTPTSDRHVKCTYSCSLHHAASRSLTPLVRLYDTTGNEFRVLIDFLDSSFDFEKKIRV